MNNSWLTAGSQARGHEGSPCTAGDCLSHPERKEDYRELGADHFDGIDEPNPLILGQPGCPPRNLGSRSLSSMDEKLIDIQAGAEANGRDQRHGPATTGPQWPSRISYGCQPSSGSSRSSGVGTYSAIVMHRTVRRTRLPPRGAFAIWALHAGGSLPIAKPSLVCTRLSLAEPRPARLLRADRAHGGFVHLPPSA